MRGVSATTVSGTSNPAAAAAAMGYGAMPTQLIPSTANTAAGVLGAPAAEDTGSSSEEALDFQLQRRARRLEGVEPTAAPGTGAARTVGSARGGGHLLRRVPRGRRRLPPLAAAVR